MITPSIAPWLDIADGRRAAEFYSAAFGAAETYRLEAPDGALILRFSVGEAEFWVSGGAAGSGADAAVEDGNAASADADSAGGTAGTARADAAAAGAVAASATGRAKGEAATSGPTRGAVSGEAVAPLGAGTIRMILTVPDPDVFFARALAAGATEVFPVGEGHGWRLGRLVDPFGLHWEIGHPLD